MEKKSNQRLTEELFTVHDIALRKQATKDKRKMQRMQLLDYHHLSTVEDIDAKSAEQL